MGGVYFISTGFLKLISPLIFKEHLIKLKLVPEFFLEPLKIFIPFLSLFIGFSLVFYYHLRLHLIIAALYIMVGTLLSIWGVKNRGLNNCGCYGALKLIPIKWSFLIHFILIIGFTLSFLYVLPHHSRGPWQSVFGATLFVIIGGKVFSMLLARRKKKLLPGDYWQRDWLENSQTNEIDLRNAYMAFINPDCQECRHWISLFNVMSELKRGFVPLAIVPQSVEKDVIMQKNLKFKFPVFRMDDELFYSLISETPTAFKLENYRVSTFWKGNVPAELTDNFAHYWGSLGQNEPSKKV